MTTSCRRNAFLLACSCPDALKQGIDPMSSGVAPFTHFSSEGLILIGKHSTYGFMVVGASWSPLAHVTYAFDDIIRKGRACTLPVLMPYAHANLITLAPAGQCLLS